MFRRAGPVAERAVRRVGRERLLAPGARSHIILVIFCRTGPLPRPREAAIEAKEKARDNKERERARAGAGGATTPAQKRANLDAKREADMRKKDEERVARIRVADEKLARQHEADALKPKTSSAK